LQQTRELLIRYRASGYNLIRLLQSFIKMLFESQASKLKTQVITIIRLQSMFKYLYPADTLGFCILSAGYIFANPADKMQEMKVSAGYKYLNPADTQKRLRIMGGEKHDA